MEFLVLAGANWLTLAMCEMKIVAKERRYRKWLELCRHSPKTLSQYLTVWRIGREVEETKNLSRSLVHWGTLFKRPWRVTGLTVNSDNRREYAFIRIYWTVEEGKGYKLQVICTKEGERKRDASPRTAEKRQLKKEWRRKSGTTRRHSYRCFEEVGLLYRPVEKSGLVTIYALRRFEQACSRCPSSVCSH